MNFMILSTFYDLLLTDNDLNKQMTVRVCGCVRISDIVTYTLCIDSLES